MSKSILNRIRIFQENISPALGPGQSRPNILLKNAQAPFYYFVNYFWIETDLRIRIYKIKKFHTTLQPDTFSILFTLPFVSRFPFCSFFVSLTFYFQLFSLSELFVITRFDWLLDVCVQFFDLIHLFSSLVASRSGSVCVFMLQVQILCPTLIWNDALVCLSFFFLELCVVLSFLTFSVSLPWQISVVFQISTFASNLKWWFLVRKVNSINLEICVAALFLVFCSLVVSMKFQFFEFQHLSRNEKCDLHDFLVFWDF